MLYNKNDVYIGGSLRKYGEFSWSEQALFGRTVRPGWVVVEVGANIGVHTVELSRLVGAGGLVFAFEPQRLAFQTLCANLALNQRTNVLAYQAALAAASGSAVVPVSDPTARTNFGGISLVDAKSGETVPVYTLDGLGLAACHFIKAGVEGMEVEVLRAATGTIARHRPILYLENDREGRSRELIEHMMALDSELYWHLAPLYDPDNFAGEKENVFPGIVSINMLCMPTRAAISVDGLRRIASPQDSWRT